MKGSAPLTGSFYIDKIVGKRLVIGATDGELYFKVKGELTINGASLISQAMPADDTGARLLCRQDFKGLSGIICRKETNSKELVKLSYFIGRKYVLDTKSSFTVIEASWGLDMHVVICKVRYDVSEEVTETYKNEHFCDVYYTLADDSPTRLVYWGGTGMVKDFALKENGDLFVIWSNGVKTTFTKSGNEWKGDNIHLPDLTFCKKCVVKRTGTNSGRFEFYRDIEFKDTKTTSYSGTWKLTEGGDVTAMIPYVENGVTELREKKIATMDLFVKSNDYFYAIGMVYRMKNIAFDSFIACECSGDFVESNLSNSWYRTIRSNYLYNCSFGGDVQIERIGRYVTDGCADSCIFNGGTVESHRFNRCKFSNCVISASPYGTSHDDSSGLFSCEVIDSYQTWKTPTVKNTTITSTGNWEIDNLINSSITVNIKDWPRSFSAVDIHRVASDSSVTLIGTSIHSLHYTAVWLDRDTAVYNLTARCDVTPKLSDEDRCTAVFLCDIDRGGECIQGERSSSVGDCDD
jgi:hypothetical protein